MRKILIALLLMVSVHCQAATIEQARFDCDDKLIYPVVHVENKAVERKINAAIVSEVDRFVTGVHHSAQEIGAEVDYVRTSYEVGSNEAGNTVILSIILNESNYYKRAAHPATYRRALNFNTATGELMDVSYLTDVGSGVPIKRLLDKLTKKLREHAARKGLYLFPESLPLKELPKDFYWDEQLHVHFIFQHYEVAPYSEGIIDVDIEA